MFSGLERQRTALSRQRSVAWAWIKANGIVNDRPMPKNSMLTTSVLRTNDLIDAGTTGNWRDSLAAITYRKLARQLCEQFYDLSIFQAWRNQTVETVSPGRMLNPALPSYCRDAESARPRFNPHTLRPTASILTAVLPSEGERRGAVLIALKSRAA